MRRRTKKDSGRGGVSLKPSYPWHPRPTPFPSVCAPPPSSPPVTYPEAISPLASASGLPHSMVIMVAISSVCRTMRSYHLRGEGGGGGGSHHDGGDILSVQDDEVIPSERQGAGRRGNVASMSRVPLCRV